jgi:hypothetical protein
VKKLINISPNTKSGGVQSGDPVLEMVLGLEFLMVHCLT